MVQGVNVRGTAQILVGRSRTAAVCYPSSHIRPKRMIASIDAWKRHIITPGQSGFPAAAVGFAAVAQPAAALRFNVDEVGSIASHPLEKDVLFRARDDDLVDRREIVVGIAKRSVILVVDGAKKIDRDKRYDLLFASSVRKEILLDQCTRGIVPSRSHCRRLAQNPRFPR